MFWIFVFISLLHAGQDCIDCSVPQSPAAAPPAPITYAPNRNCRPIEVGQGRLSDQVARQETSSIPANREYLLHRKSEKQFEVIYQLEFVPKTGSDAPVSMTGADMEARVRECLALLPPARLADGREMTFRFITPEQRNLSIGEAPPKVTINVVKASRGNAENFAEDFRCGQVIHELLHKVGLCDEYHETGGAENVGKCRPQAQGSSVMGNGMHQAYDDAAGEPFQCALPADPTERSWFTSNSFSHREFMYKKNFRSIGNRPWAAFGHTAPRTDTPKDKCCRQIGPRTRVSPLMSPDAPKVKMLSNQPGVMRFKSYEDFIVDEFQGSTNKIYIVDEFEYECGLSTVEPALQQACTEYYELLKPELESISDPARKIFSCREGDVLPPQRFDLDPGTMDINGSRVSIRNKGNGRSILHSGHFERILAGECSSPATQVYDRCSRFAYDHNYTNAQKAMSCEELLPAECKRVDWIGTLTQ